MSKFKKIQKKEDRYHKNYLNKMEDTGNEFYYI